MTKVFGWREAPAADFAVIGDPVAHSRSPQMHHAAYVALDMPYRYVAIHVPPGEVAPAMDYLRDRGYRGVNVTVPHKEEVIAWCGEVEPFAKRVRAVNTVDLPNRRGTNTDAPGFLATLAPFALDRKRALVLGAGGSARALCAALKEAGWTVRVYNRTASRAQELADSLGIEALSSADPNDADLILNTTSASIAGECPPVEWERVSGDALAVDLYYSRETTPFLREAAARGLRTLDGLPMLVEQGALALEWWLGVEAPRAAMAEAIR